MPDIIKHIIVVITLLGLILAITEADEVLIAEPVHTSLIFMMFIFVTLLNVGNLDGFLKYISATLSILLIVFSVLGILHDLSELTQNIRIEGLFVSYLEIVNEAAIVIFSLVLIFLLSKFKED